MLLLKHELLRLTKTDFNYLMSQLEKYTFLITEIITKKKKSLKMLIFTTETKTTKI